MIVKGNTVKDKISGLEFEVLAVFPTKESFMGTLPTTYFLQSLAAPRIQVQRTDEQVTKVS